MIRYVCQSIRDVWSKIAGRRTAVAVEPFDDVEDILQRVDRLPVLNELSAGEILAYDEAGLPT